MRRLTLSAAIIALMSGPAWAAPVDGELNVPIGGESVDLGRDMDAQAAKRGGGGNRGGGNKSAGGGNRGGGGKSTGGSRRSGGRSAGGQQGGGRHAGAPSRSNSNRAGNQSNGNRGNQTGNRNNSGNRGQQAGNRNNQANNNRGGAANHRVSVSNRSGAKNNAHNGRNGAHRAVANKRAPGAGKAAHRGGAPKYRLRAHDSVVFQRWKPSYHRYHLGNGHRHAWAHGVFIYSPPPRRTVVVNGREKVIKSKGKNRAVNRNGDFSLGLAGGSYMSSYYGNEGAFGDFGLGLNLGYRPVEALGLEVNWMHHDNTWDEETERISSPLSTSVALYAFPWTRVSPYVTAGLSWTGRSYTDTFYTGADYEVVEVSDTLFGPHMGLGMEFAVGENAAIDFEGRVLGFVNKDADDPSAPAAVQGLAGLNLYF